MKQHDVFSSDLGWIGLSLGAHGVRYLVFDQPSARLAWQTLRATSPGVPARCALSASLREQLCRYAQGQTESLDEVSVDWSGLTSFQVRVMQACRAIPWGQTRTYGQLAAEVGSPGAARAVGGVMSRNRVPLIIPCHRVVGSGGALGGFSSRTGLRMKRRLLQMESAHSATDNLPAELLPHV